LAAELDLPQLTLATELTVTAGRVRVRREIGDAAEVLEAPLPALVSVTDQANEPRYPAFKAIRAARKKPVDTLTLADLGLASPPARPPPPAAPRRRRLPPACPPSRAPPGSRDASSPPPATAASGWRSSSSSPSSSDVPPTLA